MNNLNWNKEKLSQLDSLYLKNVIENVKRGRDQAIDAEIRFGETGTGQSPNYQINFPPNANKPDGVVLIFRGMTHKTFELDDSNEFNNEKISEPFKLIDLESALEITRK